MFPIFFSFSDIHAYALIFSDLLEKLEEKIHPRQFDNLIYRKL
jgi:hypothetical protein